MTAWSPATAHEFSVEELYHALRARGYAYGPDFRLQRLWRDGAEVLAESALGEQLGADASSFQLHPALLDAACHAVFFAQDPTDERTLLPYSIGSVRLRTRGARVVRVTVTPAAEDSFDIHIIDASGQTVADITDLRLRPVSPRALRAAVAAAEPVVFWMSWRPAQLQSGPADSSHWVVVGPTSELSGGTYVPELTDLISTAADRMALPEVVLLDWRDPQVQRALPPQAADVHRRVSLLLNAVQLFLADDRFQQSRLVVLVTGAHSVRFAEPEVNLAAAACAGLIRTAQQEHPGRLQLIDLGDAPAESAALAAAVASSHPLLALRDATAYVPRLALPDVEHLIALPDSGPWRLIPGRSGTLDEVAAVAAPDTVAPLEPDQLRIKVHASGVNFRDPMTALAMVEGDAIGCEVAGYVVDVGTGVTNVRVGDRVAAFAGVGGRDGLHASLAVVDRRSAWAVPAHWNDHQAAGISGVFVTAFDALVKRAGVQAGDKILIHAAAGGVGMAAIQLATHLGADIYATASRSKWDVVKALGVPQERIADSRSLDFEQRIRSAAGGKGLDVVIGSLAGDFVDASLRLLRPGGCYVELGKTDIRDARAVGDQYPGIVYHVIDLLSAPPEHMENILVELGSLFADGILRPLPTRSWNVRHARSVFRHLSSGHSVGKLVLSQGPDRLGPDGTVLITGGTGTLGMLLARHLVTAHGVRHLVLATRHGAATPHARQLKDELSALGATVTLPTCDAADRTALAEILASIPAAHPLRAVIHAAGLLDDCMVMDLTPDRLQTVMHAKVTGALNLHDLTLDTNLRAFVLYSSMSSLIGYPAQANYAAANAFLDALAHYRRAHGMTGTSINWGLWEESSGMTSHLTGADLTRVRRYGLAPLPTERALAGFDLALELDEPQLAIVPSPSPAGDEPLPELFTDLLPHVSRRTAPKPMAGARHDPAGEGDDDLAARLVSLPPAHRLAQLVGLVRGHAAAVLGHRDPSTIDAERLFRDAGLDSLASTELRNRLASAVGVKLAATAVFDHPTPAALAGHLETLLAASSPTHEAAGRQQARSGENSDELTTSYIEACIAGDFERATRLVRPWARRRCVFRSTSDGRHREPVHLADGATGPTVVCLPSIGSPPGASHYARLAAEYDGHRAVWALEAPGYQDAEAVPESLEVLLDFWVETLGASDASTPYVLLGHSSGGWFAHALAARLHERQRPTVGLVLLDTLPPGTRTHQLFQEAASRLAEHATAAYPTAATLSAASAYLDLLADWSPSALGVPTLFLHPSDSSMDLAWPFPHHRIDVLGDHFSVLDQHSKPAAAAIEGWLTSLGGHAPRTVLLEGGPPELAREHPHADATDKVTIDYRGHHEHYQATGEQREADGRLLPIFRWGYRTKIAE